MHRREYYAKYSRKYTTERKYTYMFSCAYERERERDTFVRTCVCMYVFTRARLCAHLYVCAGSTVCVPSRTEY